jgi:hypothetical protein
MIDLLFSGTRGSMLPTWLCGFPFLRPLPSCQAGGGNGICHEPPFFDGRCRGLGALAALRAMTKSVAVSILYSGNPTCVDGMGLGPASPHHDPSGNHRIVNNGFSDRWKSLITARVRKGLNFVDFKRCGMWPRRLPTRSVTITGNKACVCPRVRVCRMPGTHPIHPDRPPGPLPNGTSLTEEQAPFANLFAPASDALRDTSVLRAWGPRQDLPGLLACFLRLVPFSAHDTHAPGPAPSRGSTSRFKSGR